MCLHFCLHLGLDVLIVLMPYGFFFSFFFFFFLPFMKGAEHRKKQTPMHGK